MASGSIKPPLETPMKVQKGKNERSNCIALERNLVNRIVNGPKMPPHAPYMGYSGEFSNAEAPERQQ